MASADALRIATLFAGFDDADLVLAGVNEALRSAAAAIEAKAQQMQSELLGGLGLPGMEP